jgi:hypothetical protein
MEEERLSDTGFRYDVSGMTDIGWVISGYRRITKEVVIPDQIDGQPVTAIGNWVFAEHRISSVTIPDSVTAIGYRAFYRNRLTSVIIPDSVTSIGNNAFLDNQLTSVKIPGLLTIINDGIFAKNKLTSVTIPDSVRIISRYAFEHNPLTSVTIGAGVTIEADVFPGNLGDIYQQGGELAGTYVSGDDGNTWTKQDG